MDVINQVWANIILQYPELYNVFSQQTQTLVNNLKNAVPYQPPTISIYKQNMTPLLIIKTKFFIN